MFLMENWITGLLNEILQTDVYKAFDLALQDV